MASGLNQRSRILKKPSKTGQQHNEGLRKVAKLLEALQNKSLRGVGGGQKLGVNLQEMLSQSGACTWSEVLAISVYITLT